MATPLSLIIFDWDGTIADSLAIIAFSHAEAAKELQLPLPDPALVKKLIGLSADEVVQQLYPGKSIEIYQEIIRVYRQHYFKNAHKIFLYPGVFETIEYLHQAGFLLAIATGKSRQGLICGLQEAGLNSFFTITRTAEETASKPNPLMVQEILETLEIPSAAAVMIGDTEYDMQLAQNAGIKAIAVSYGAHSEEQLQRYFPYACLSDIRELKKLVTMTS